MVLSAIYTSSMESQRSRRFLGPRITPQTNWHSRMSMAKLTQATPCKRWQTLNGSLPSLANHQGPSVTAITSWVLSARAV